MAEQFRGTYQFYGSRGDETTLDRRSLTLGAALLISLAAAPIAEADVASTEPEDSQTHLAEVPLGSGATLTIERRGQVALFGINRPHIQNRIDPETFRALAKAYHDYDHDPSLRAAVLFGHGEHFSRGIDVDAFKALVAANQAWISKREMIDPLAKGEPFLSKPLIAAVHGDTWNMADELFLVADIRVAAANTNFGQDENTHGRFPGGGSTIRFVREAGWGNAMRYILTGDHWTAAGAYRMRTVQEVLPTPEAALQKAIELADKIAACGPLGIKASLPLISRSTRLRRQRWLSSMHSSEFCFARGISRKAATPKRRVGGPSTWANELAAWCAGQ